MVITHAVVDIEQWVNGKAERAATIGAFATKVTDYVAADGSNNIAIPQRTSAANTAGIAPAPAPRQRTLFNTSLLDDHAAGHSLIGGRIDEDE
jgi:carbohydrate-binding DOMON domain-containing protein